MSPELLERLDRGINPTRNLRVLATIRRVGKKHGVLPSRILSRSRKKRDSLARQELCWRLYHRLGLSYERIGNEIGRDHSTAQYNAKKYAAKLVAGLEA